MPRVLRLTQNQLEAILVLGQAIQLDRGVLPNLKLLNVQPKSVEILNPPTVKKSPGFVMTGRTVLGTAFKAMVVKTKSEYHVCLCWQDDYKGTTHRLGFEWHDKSKVSMHQSLQQEFMYEIV